MSTNSTATQMECRNAEHVTAPQLDWFTDAVLLNGRQICAIRPIFAAGPRQVLSESESALLQAILHELAQDEAIPFGIAKQAVLRAFANSSQAAGLEQ
jgi:hypothetical protein